MAPMTELSVADFDRVWAVNGRGVFMGLRAVLKVMKPRRSGAIVNTASMAAIKGAATFSPYIASKHAVLGLTKSAALEGGAIRHPGQLRRPRPHRHEDGPRPYPADQPG